MRVRLATGAGAADRANEDHAGATATLLVVTDGVTARTDTGCRHGTAWYAAELTAAVLRHDTLTPAEALRAGIAQVTAAHAGDCDLAHPATPCAAVAVVGVAGGALRWAVLGDVTVVLARGGVVTRAVSDRRVEAAGAAERAEAGRYPPGSPARADALGRMKRAEIAARNRPGGHWVAGTVPAAADHALTGAVARERVDAVAVLTDGAVRLVEPFGLLDWAGALAVLAGEGPDALIARVRAAERTDPQATRWPRTKVADDATAAYATDLGDDPL